MYERLYISFGVSFLPTYRLEAGTEVFVWTRTLKADLCRRLVASLAGEVMDRRSLGMFGGDPAPIFLSVMSSSVYDASASIPRRKLPTMIHGVYAPTGWHDE